MTATEISVSGNAEDSFSVSRATTPSTDAAASRRPSKGSQNGGVAARSRNVNAISRGPASNAALRIAVRWVAASSVSYSGSVTDSRASVIRRARVSGVRVPVNVQGWRCV